MRVLRVLVLLFTIATMGACVGTPETVVVVVTSPPNAPAAEATTAVPSPAGTTEVTPTTDAAETAEPAATVEPAGTTEPAETAEAGAAQVPTVTVSQIQVAEQTFQRGRMFWVQPTAQIWVMVEDENDPTRGTWEVYPDNFVEGDPETDPEITPPRETLLQPERGFGLVWRENPEVREQLGWAREPEVGHVSNYEFQPQGEVVNGEWVAAPGYHVLSSVYGYTFRFNEVNGTWQTVDTPGAN